MSGQMMLNVCEDWADEYNVTFSTDPNPTKSKSKVIFVRGRRKNRATPAPLLLYSVPLPYVTTASHLGHELHESGTMDHDMMVKRAIYISRSMEIREQFAFAHPREQLAATKLYAGSFYGSNLWELGGEMAAKVYNTWRVGARDTWGVTRTAHRYVVDNLLVSNMTSTKYDILLRYPKFYENLLESPSPEVAFMAAKVGKDLTTVTGRNLQFIEEVTKLDALKSSKRMLKEELMELETVPEGEEWVLEELGELLELQQKLRYWVGEEEEDEEEKMMLEEAINALCIN
jgi:hypothetical protein